MRKKARHVVVGAGLSALLFSASQAAVHELRPPDLQRMLSSPSNDVFLLDVRTTPEFVGGHVPGAKVIPMNDVISCGGFT